MRESTWEESGTKQEVEAGQQSNNQGTLNLRRKKPTAFMKQEQDAIKSKKCKMELIEIKNMKATRFGRAEELLQNTAKIQAMDNKLEKMLRIRQLILAAQYPIIRTF